MFSRNLAFTFLALNVTLLTSLTGPLAHANGAEDSTNAMYSARSQLRDIESQARLKPTWTDMPNLAQAEVDALVVSNDEFLAFAAQDCLNSAYHSGGAVGGSALGEDVADCQTALIQSRIGELNKRYGLK